jgi:hypothetical protein
MKIVSFGADRSEQPGVLIDDQHIVPLAGILAAAGLPPTLDTNAILAFLSFLQPIIEEELTKKPRSDRACVDTLGAAGATA